MSISNYTELQTAIGNWLDRTDMAARAPEFIALAEAQMNRRLRVRQMVTRAEAALSSEFTDAPGDIIEPIHLTLEISESDIRFLEYMAPERLLAEKACISAVTAAEPEFYSIVGGSIQLLPTPDQSYTGELTYWAKIPALATNSTNWLLTNFPDAYLYGSLIQAGPQLASPEDIATWGTLFATALADVQASNRIAGGKLRTEIPLIGRQRFDITRGW